LKWKKIKTQLKYCENCQRNVEAEKDFNGCAFVALLIFTLGIGAVIYLIVYASKEPDMCPYCHRGKFLRAPREKPQKPVQKVIYVQQIQPEVKSSGNYCPNCGVKLSKDAKYCELCGSEIK